MRDIKFRIWDTEDLIYPDQNFNFNNAVFWNIRTTGCKTIKVDTLNDQSLMHFTGLQDKNEKDIYDGDLLKDDKLIYEVEWNAQNAKFCINPIAKIDGEISLIDTLHYKQLGNGYYSRKDLEVIGNIHQNKELLK